MHATAIAREIRWTRLGSDISMSSLLAQRPYTPADELIIAVSNRESIDVTAVKMLLSRTIRSASENVRSRSFKADQPCLESRG